VSGPQSPLESQDRPIRSGLVLPEGIEAGLVAATMVVVALWIRDASIGEPLHTPSVLGALVFQGLEAARVVRSDPGLAAAYNVVHYILWIIGGFAASRLMGAVARGAAAWWLPGLALGLVILAYVGLDALVAETALTRPRFWIGGVAGATTLAAFLAWRHPDAIDRMRHFGRP
jgi:hypothetical protein